jgi:hypothetical protein
VNIAKQVVHPGNALFEIVVLPMDLGSTSLAIDQIEMRVGRQFEPYRNRRLLSCCTSRARCASLG